MSQAALLSGRTISFTCTCDNTQLSCAEFVTNDVADLLRFVDDPDSVSTPRGELGPAYWSFFDLYFPEVLQEIKLSRSAGISGEGNVASTVLLLDAENFVRDACSLELAAGGFSVVPVTSNITRAIVAWWRTKGHRASVHANLIPSKGNAADPSRDAFPEDVQAVETDPPSEPTASEKEETVRSFLKEKVKRAAELRTSGRPIEALAIVDKMDADSPVVRRELARLYHRLKMHEKCIELHQSLDAADRWDPGYLVPALEAFVNLGEQEKASDLLLELMLNTEVEEPTAAALLRIFPFAVLGATPFRDWIQGAIVEKAFQGKPPLGHLLHFAHVCLTADKTIAFQKAHRAAAALARTPEELARVDILKAQLAFSCGNHNLQEEYVNRALARFGLPGLARKDAAAPVVVSNLLNAPNKTVNDDGPLVTVVMTTFNRADCVRLAAESVLNQSWRNLELIIVDDASSDNTTDVVRQLQAEDARVKLVCLSENGGTYKAKNFGLVQANGEFVSCQDSDDWAHPEKIRVGVETLLTNSNAVASTVQHVRCNETNGFKSRMGYIRKDFSSFLFRRESVLSNVGYFDSVRVGADAEMQMRVAKTFGSNSIVELPQLLSIVDWSENTLTGGGNFRMDDEIGYMSPYRTKYRRAFLGWHEENTSLFVPFPSENRVFEF